MKSALRLAAIAAIALSGPLSSPAQQPGARGVTLDECVQMALAKNLDLRLARYSPEFSKINIWGDAAAWDPRWTTSLTQGYARQEAGRLVGVFNPNANESWTEQFNSGVTGTSPWGLGYQLNTSMTRSSGFNLAEVEVTNPQTGLREKRLVATDSGFFYTPSVNLGLSQPLLKDAWIDATRWQIQLDKKALLQDQQDVRGQVIKTVTDVQIAYYDLIYARENLRVQRMALERAEKFFEQQKRKVEVGALAPLDEMKAKSEMARVRGDLLDAERNLNQAQNTLKSLVADDFAGLESTRFEPSEPLSTIPTAFNKFDSWNKALANRPEIVRSRIELERQKITLKYRRNQLFPQLDLTGSYGVRGFDTMLTPSLEDIEERRNPNHSAGIRLIVPMSNRGARANLKSAKLANEQLLLRHKKLEQDIIRAIDDDIYSAQNALYKIEAAKVARITAEATLDAEQKKLENGKSTTLDVLDAQRALTSAQSEEIRAQSDYNKALSRLSQDEASTLDRAGVKLDIR